MERVLEGIRVLDLGRYVAGPYCALLLADMGAEVIRVERPGGEPDRFVSALTAIGWGVNYINLARNKKAITLNLRHEKGRELIKHLVAQCDIVVGSYRGGEMESVGLGYDVLSQINPGIIVVLISGFGQTGPYARRLAFDTHAQAISGAMSLCGFPGNPPTKSSVFYVDFGTGIHGALGAVLALYHRQKTGRGQLMDAALVDTAITFMHGVPAEYKVAGKSRCQLGNQAWYAIGNLYQAKDGWVYIYAVTNHLWRNLIKALGKENLGLGLESDQERFEHHEVIDIAIQEWVSQRTVAETIAILDEADVPSGPVYSVPEMLSDAHIKAREIVKEIDQPGLGKIPVVGSAIKLSETPGSVDGPAPGIGEHNKEIYGGLLGLSDKELVRLKEEGVI